MESHSLRFWISLSKAGFFLGLTLLCLFQASFVLLPATKLTSARVHGHAFGLVPKFLTIDPS